MRRQFLGVIAVFAMSVAALGAEQATAPRAKAKTLSGGPVVNGDATRSPVGSMSIDGRPSTLVGCAGGNFYNTHALGFATAGTRIVVDILSGDNIDPIAAASILQLGASAPDSARMSFVSDDDSGGNLDPRLSFTLSFDSNVVLSVGSFTGSFGCYWVKVEVTAP